MLLDVALLVSIPYSKISLNDRLKLADSVLIGLNGYIF